MHFIHTKPLLVQQLSPVTYHALHLTLASDTPSVTPHPTYIYIYNIARYNAPVISPCHFTRCISLTVTYTCDIPGTPLNITTHHTIPSAPRSCKQLHPALARYTLNTHLTLARHTLKILSLQTTVRYVSVNTIHPPHFTRYTLTGKRYTLLLSSRWNNLQRTHLTSCALPLPVRSQALHITR